jgi:Skp family chaperone for outer membrane proteins
MSPQEVQENLLKELQKSNALLNSIARDLSSLLFEARKNHDERIQKEIRDREASLIDRFKRWVG